MVPEVGAARAERVRAATERMPVAAHAELAPWAGRDPLAILEQGRSRVPELLPIRYGRMLASPFAFYRGAAAVMAADLAASGSTGLTVQLCGDAHVSNFGLFATPERKQVFDLNDFDETWPGPFDWDVKRLAASLEIAGRGNGLRRKQRRALTAGTVRALRQAMAEFAAQPALEVWYARAEVQPGLPRLTAALPKAARSASRKVITKSRGRDAAHAVTKLTKSEFGQQRFVSDPPILVPVREAAPEVADDLTTSWTRSSRSTAPASSPIAAFSSTAFRSSTWPARRSASGGRRRVPGSCSSSTAGQPPAAPGQGGRRVGPGGLTSPGRRWTTRVAASSRASASCRQAATSSSGGSTSPASTAWSATSTCASSAT